MRFDVWFIAGFVVIFVTHRLWLLQNSCVQVSSCWISRSTVCVRAFVSCFVLRSMTVRVRGCYSTRLASRHYCVCTACVVDDDAVHRMHHESARVCTGVCASVVFERTLTGSRSLFPPGSVQRVLGMCYFSVSRGYALLSLDHSYVGKRSAGLCVFFFSWVVRPACVSWGARGGISIGGRCPSCSGKIWSTWALSSSPSPADIPSRPAHGGTRWPSWRSTIPLSCTIWRRRSCPSLLRCLK